MTKASCFLLCPLGWHIKRKASSPASRLCGCWNSAGWCWNSSCCHSAKEGPSTKDSDNFQPHIPRVGKQSIPFLSPQWSVSAPQWWVPPFMNRSYLEMIPQTRVHLVSPIAYIYVPSKFKYWCLSAGDRVPLKGTRQLIHPCLLLLPRGYGERLAVYETGRPLPGGLQTSLEP